MVSNTIKVAFRNLARHKVFGLLNIAGLTLGLTACLLIGFFVYDEKTYDKFLPEADNIYRIYYLGKGEEGISKIGTTPPVFTTELQENFPEVDKTVRLLNLPSKILFQAGDKKMYEEGGLFSDSAFFDVFQLPLKYGSYASALSKPNSIVLTDKLAEKYFGNDNPIGKELKFEQNTFLVGAVVKHNPKFHLPFNYIIPMSAAGVPAARMKVWDWYQFINYVKLKPGADFKALQAKFQSHSAPFLKGEGTVFTPMFQPVHDIHLYAADFKYDISDRGNITYVNALTIIAVFILLIACFNFVNLATAKSLQRAKEVGVRKTVGAGRNQLIYQFIGETIILTLISMLLAVVLCLIFLPFLNQFTGKSIPLNLFADPLFLLVVFGLSLLVGILAGFYPALILSGYKPVNVLKGVVVQKNQGNVPWLRHSLVVIQFSLSILLIISAFVVIRQVNYLHDKELGFDKEEIMFFEMRGENMEKNYESFKNEILKSPNISSVSIGYGFPGDMFGDGMMTVVGEGKQVSQKATQLMVDQDYVKTLGLKIVAGRDFAKEIATDKDKAWIINETAAKEFGFKSPDQAIGKTLSWPTWANADSPKVGQVIGVVKDFHFKSLYEKVEPAVLQIYPSAYWKVAVKMKTANMPAAIDHVKTAWNKFNAISPLEYNFLDESFAQMYKAEDKLKSLLWIFTAITIFVACLGLFGLAAYAAERRKKEIGIRKVLGATVNGLVMHLSKDFVKLILIALVVATPLAWYFMNGWLQDFAYRIDLSWWMFVIAGILSIAIALLTVSFQAIKAAISNPINNLRNE